MLKHTLFNKSSVSNLRLKLIAGQSEFKLYSFRIFSKIVACCMNASQFSDRPDAKKYYMRRLRSNAVIGQVRFLLRTLCGRPTLNNSDSSL